MQLHRVSELGFQLRANGVSISEVGLRVQRDRLDERDLVIVYPPLGLFSIDDRFSLELKTKDEVGWRQVYVADVKREINARLPEIDVATLPSRSERLERALLEQRRSSLVAAKFYLERFAPSPDPIRRAAQVLYEAGIPCLVEDSLPNDNRSSKTTVIWVPYLVKSRIRLRRAGFYQDARSRTLLFHGETGQRIELVERPCVG